MDKNMVSPTITHKLSRKMDNFQEKLSHPRPSSLRNEDLRQTRAKSGTIQILPQEKEQRLQERVMNVEERRYEFDRSPWRAFRRSDAHYWPFKIRCDAESETPGVQCSACKRADLVCDFRRAPQKRGPSKGYVDTKGYPACGQVLISL